MFRYVFSRGALRKVGPRLVQLLTEPRNPNQGLEICYDTATQEEDVKLGACFKEVYEQLAVCAYL